MKTIFILLVGFFLNTQAFAGYLNGEFGQVNFKPSSREKLQFNLSFRVTGAFKNCLSGAWWPILDGEAEISDRGQIRVLNFGGESSFFEKECWTASFSGVKEEFSPLYGSDFSSWFGLNGDKTLSYDGVVDFLKNDFTAFVPPRVTIEFKVKDGAEANAFRVDWIKYGFTNSSREIFGYTYDVAQYISNQPTSIINPTMAPMVLKGSLDGGLKTEFEVQLINYNKNTKKLTAVCSRRFMFATDLDALPGDVNVILKSDCREETD